MHAGRLDPDPDPDPAPGTDPGTGDPGTGDPGGGTTTPGGGTTAPGGGTTTPPASGGGTPPLPNVAGGLLARFRAGPAATRVLTLDARTLAKGTLIEVRCTGRGCPKGIARYRVTRSRSTLSLRSAKLRAAKLRPGAVLEIRIMRAGHVGLAISHRIRARKAPVRTTRCLPPGAGKPVRCA